MRTYFHTLLIGMTKHFW